MCNFEKLPPVVVFDLIVFFQNQEIPESSKSNSSNSSVRDRDATNMEHTKKKASDRVERGQNGEVLSYTTEDDITYRISGKIIDINTIILAQS